MVYAALESWKITYNTDYKVQLRDYNFLCFKFGQLPYLKKVIVRNALIILLEIDILS